MTATIAGTLGRDPELRFTPTGQATCTFGVAVNRRWQTKGSTEWQEQTSWFDVTVWGAMAENVAESLHKGDRVVISGRLEQQSWETAEGKRSRVVLVADEVGPSLRWATATINKVKRETKEETW